MYRASCRCGTGRSFDAKIVKIGWYILWPCKMGEFEDGTYWPNKAVTLDVTELRDISLGVVL